MRNVHRTHSVQDSSKEEPNALDTRTVIKDGPNLKVHVRIPYRDDAVLPLVLQNPPRFVCCVLPMLALMSDVDTDAYAILLFRTS